MTAAMALLPMDPSLALCCMVDPRSSWSPSCSIVRGLGSECVAWLMRRKESRERREPDNGRLCPVLALSDRVRVELAAMDSALLVSPSPIGAGRGREVGVKPASF